MRLKPAIAIAAIGLFSLPAQAASPSFDCSKATHEAELLICKDSELASLDRSLAELYATVLKNTPEAQQARLKAEQRGWVKGRDACWKFSDQRGCIKDAYEQRIRELKDR